MPFLQPLFARRADSWSSDGKDRIILPKRNASSAALPLLPLKAAPAPAVAAEDAAAWHIKSAAAVQRLASLGKGAQLQQELSAARLAEDEMDSARSIMALQQDAAAPAPAPAAAEEEEEATWLPVDLELTAEEASWLVRPPCLSTAAAADFAPPAPVAEPQLSQATAAAYRSAANPRSLMRRAARGMRSGAARLRSSLAPAALFAARRRPAVTTFTPTVADGWTKTYVNWC